MKSYSIPSDALRPFLNGASLPCGRRLLIFVFDGETVTAVILTAVAGFVCDEDEKSLRIEVRIDLKTGPVCAITYVYGEHPRLDDGRRCLVQADVIANNSVAPIYDHLLKKAYPGAEWVDTTR